ncbi:hypothetical protein Tco_0934709 [Tanacetum coccineum]
MIGAAMRSLMLDAHVQREMSFVVTCLIINGGQIYLAILWRWVELWTMGRGTSVLDVFISKTQASGHGEDHTEQIMETRGLCMGEGLFGGVCLWFDIVGGWNYEEGVGRRVGWCGGGVSLADARSKTHPPMLERGPYQMKHIQPNPNEPPRPQNEVDLMGDDLKQYEADIKAINLILISIPNDIYNSIDACQSVRDMWDMVKRLMQAWMYEKLVIASRAKKAAKTHDPLALVANISYSSSRSLPPYYVRHPSSMVDYDDDHQGDTFNDDQEDSLTSAMMLLAYAITQCYSTPTNNRLRTSSNTRN